MQTKAKKSLGQNFLIDRNIQRKIIDACKLACEDIVLEIGPGRGELTNLIARAGVKKLYAVELDALLAQTLTKAFQDTSRVEIISGDILKVDLEKYFRGFKNLKVVGNIPYYITTPILERVVTLRDTIALALFTVQKEFARRIVATPGSKEYGSFSCFVRYYADARILFSIPRTCFRPMPEVDSCVLKLAPRYWRGAAPLNEKMLFRIIRSAFNQRRKTLRNSLKESLPPHILGIFFETRHIGPNTRPEQISLDDFITLTNLACNAGLKP